MTDKEKDKYVINEKVFAKLKGFPPWPARILEKVSGTGKDVKYRLIFYGSHDEATVKLDQLFKYTEETKAKYGKPSKKAAFNEAMAEIEEHIRAEEAGETGMEEEVPEPKLEDNAKKEEEAEGELMIDEGPPSLPPVLKREVDNVEPTPTPTITPGPGGIKSKKARNLTKRESISTPAAPVTPATTPVQPEALTSGGTEIVSRSGRKIKPKRFADDEITPVGKSKSTSEETAAKRPKRGSVSGRTPAAAKSSEEQAAPTLDVVPESTPKSPVPKGKSETPVPPSDNKGPPTLKAVPKRSASASANKQLPTLEPIQATSSRKSQRISRQLSVEAEERKDKGKKENGHPAAHLEEEGNVADVDDNEVDKENSNDQSYDDQPLESNNQNDPPKPQDAESPSSATEKKIRIATKQGLQVELSFESQKPDSKSEDENKKWQFIAGKNLHRVIEDLKEDDIESQEIINTMAEGIPSLSAAQECVRDKLALQLRLLRLEGEVIEIIGEIVGCLGIHSADCARALDLLERLEEHKLNKLLLKKHPEVVHTVQKLRNYVGNVDQWGFDDQQKAEFETYAEEIRKKAVSVYNHFQEVFEAKTSEEFLDVFDEEVKTFKEKVDRLPLKKILGLTEDNGELLELPMEVNGDAEEDFNDE